MTEQISSIPLFAGLRPRDVATVRRLSDLVDFPRGTLLCSSGGRVGQFVVVVDGEVLVRRGSRTVACGPGSHFGAQELLARRRPDATVWSDSRVRMFVMEPRAFTRMLELVPVVSRRLLQQFAMLVPDDSSLFCVDPHSDSAQLDLVSLTG